MGRTQVGVSVLPIGTSMSRVVALFDRIPTADIVKEGAKPVTLPLHLNTSLVHYLYSIPLSFTLVSPTKGTSKPHYE